MPKLENPRHEKFARERARVGVTLTEAYRRANYKAQGDRYAKALGKRHDIVQRIEEIRDGGALSETDDFGPLVDELMRLARKAASLETGPGWIAARGMLAEAVKLKKYMIEQGLGGEAGFEGSWRGQRPQLTPEEWAARYVPNG